MEILLTTSLFGEFVSQIEDIFSKAIIEVLCDALRDLVLFVQFEKRKKYQWRSVIFS